MKTKFNGVLTLLLALVVQLTFAQERSISGVVSDGLGPISDITVLVKGTDNGTVTDFDGNYTIKAKTGDTLIFSHVSYETIEQVVGASNTFSVTLNDAGNVLDEVVITALGIKREKKALGYAVSTIKSDELEQKAEGDFTRILNGKASGVVVSSSSGLSGSGTRLNIRGLTSIDNNNALFVVDGVPFNSDTNGSGRLQSSRSLDIDPNNIESVSILKGLSAATLYGSDGRNGVVIITTKNGKGGNINQKSEISVSQSFFINQIASLPEFSKRRGRGYYGLYYSYSGNWGADFGSSGQLGIDENGLVPHPLDGRPNTEAFPEFNGALTKYQRYNSHEDFFQTGQVSSTSINASGGNEKASYNVSYGKLEDEGFIGGNKLSRNNFGIGGNMKLNNKFTVNANLNATFSKYKTPLVGTVLGSLYQMNTDYDLLNLPYESPLDGSEIYYKGGHNPLWIQKNAGANQNTNRLYGKFQVGYEVNDWFNVTYRIGIDTYTELNRLFINKGATSDIFFSDINDDRNDDGADSTGRLQSSTVRTSVFDHTFMFSINKRINDNFNLTSEIGANSKSTKNEFQGTNSFGQSVFGANEHNFFENHTSASYNSKLNRPALFGQFTFDYKSYLFLTASGRQEWTSNFVNNSIFYPGASISYLPTKHIEGLKSDVINYLKLRFAYGSSAGFDTTETNYPTFSNVNLNPTGFTDSSGTAIQTFSVPNFNGNSALNPFLINEIEGGIESQWARNRISLNLSYYTRKTTDLIFLRPFDPSVGITSSYQNINEFKTNGIEIDLGIKPIKTDNFEWDLNVLFTKNDSEVTDLDDESVAYVTPFDTELGNYLIEGQPVTIIMGTVVDRNEDGELLVTGGGDAYQINPERQIIGDANPDFISSMSNTIRYKNLSFSMLWQYQKGGDMYLSTANTLLNRGLTAATDHLDAAAVYVLPGVINTGTVENPIYVQNNIGQDTGDLYLNIYGSADEFSIFDATTIRLQDVSLSYSLPKDLINKTPFGNVSLSLSGQNLWFKAINVPEELNIDTNAVGTNVGENGTGFELGGSPSSRRYGMSLKLTF